MSLNLPSNGKSAFSLKSCGAPVDNKNLIAMLPPVVVEHHAGRVQMKK